MRRRPLSLRQADLGSDAEIAALFGLWPHFSPISLLAALPIAAWEFSLGLYLVVKGFRPAPIAVAFDAERA